MSTAAFLKIMGCYQEFIDPKLYRALVNNGQRMGQKARDSILRVIYALIERLLGKEKFRQTVQDYYHQGQARVQTILKGVEKEVQRAVRQAEKQERSQEETQCDHLFI